MDAGGGLADLDDGGGHHLVTLTSVEEGRYDETVRLDYHVPLDRLVIARWFFTVRTTARHPV